MASIRLPRDPRVRPRVGDVLCRQGTTRTVIRLLAADKKTELVGSCRVKYVVWESNKQEVVVPIACWWLWAREALVKVKSDVL